MILTNKAPWVTMGLFAPVLCGMELPEPKNTLFTSSSASTTLWQRDATTALFVPSGSLSIHKDLFGIREYTGKAPLRLIVSSGLLSLFSPRDQHTYRVGAVGLCALDRLAGRCAYTTAESDSKTVGVCDANHIAISTFKHALLGLAWSGTSLVALHEKELVRMDLDETGKSISQITHAIKPVIPASFSGLQNGFFGALSAENTYINIFSYDSASLVDLVVNLPKGCEDARLRPHDFEGSFLFSVCGKKKIAFFSAPKKGIMPKVEFTLEAPVDETFVDCAIKLDEEYLFATFTKDTDSRAGVRCWKITDCKQSFAYWYLPNSTVTRIFQDGIGLIFSDERSMTVIFSPVQPAEDQQAKNLKHENNPQ